ncbi:MAG: DNA repair protein RecO [Candidatus Omnitrophica bacterium]|nr:DNA repair protein RecO [Candidatus Omnitrophota bacterium]
MIEKDLGFVLRRHNFRETSIIASLFTRKFGKISGIFKGFYTPKKEFSSSLSIGTLNEFIFYPKKRDIWLVSFADCVHDYPYLRQNLAKSKAALTFINIIERTMQPWDSNAAVFSLVKDSLDFLAKEKEDKMLYIFLIKYLTLSGLKPQFNKCLLCHDAFAGTIFFSVSKGGLLCKECQHHAPDARRISKETSSSLLYIQNNDFPFVCRLHPTRGCEKEIYHLLHSFLAYHLEFDALPKFPLGNSWKKTAIYAG